MHGSIYHIPKHDTIIQAKCRKCVEFNSMTRVALALGGECVIEPQKNITGFMFDGVFTIKDPNSDNMPGICLEIGEDGHNREDENREKQREEVICSFNHRILRVAIGRHATYVELDVFIQQIVYDVRLIVRDMQCDFNKRHLRH